MDALKKIFPFSFGTKDVVSLIIKIVIYVVIGAIAGVLIGVLAKIPVVNIFTGILGALVELYVLGGIIVAILSYLKIVK